MARRMILFLLFCFCCLGIMTGSLVERDQVCSEDVAEGLELIQKTVTKHGDTAASSQNQSSKESLSPPWKEAGFEKALLEQSDAQKIKFRARHKDWIDIVELYNDGFFQRYHSRDAGIWSMKKNQLVLNWLTWGEESLQSTDGGQTFHTPGNGKFTLRSYARPPWWKNRFDSIVSSNSSNSENAEVMNKTAIIAAHRNGWSADLNEKGYQAVAQLKDNSQMRVFIRRLMIDLGLQLKEEGGMQGLLPYYSGVKAVQNFNNLAAELKRNALEGKHRWVSFIDKGVEQKFN